MGNFIETGLAILSETLKQLMPALGLNAETTLAQLAVSGLIGVIYLASILSLLIGIGIWKLKKWAGYLGIIISLISIVSALFTITATLGSLIYYLVILILTITSLKYLR